MLGALCCAFTAHAGLVTQSGPRVYGGGGGDPPLAAEFFIVASGGSDSNDCSEGAPCTIDALNTKRADYAGKVVSIGCGVYDVGSKTEYAAGAAIIFGIASGTEGDPTVIQAETPRCADFDGNGTDLTMFGWAPGNCTGNVGCTGNVEFRDFEIYDTDGYGFLIWCSYDTTPTYGCENVLIEGMYVHDGEFYSLEPDNYPVVMFAGCDSCTVRDNLVHDWEAPGDGGGAVLVQLYSSRNTIVEYNTCYALDRCLDDKHGNVGNGVLQGTKFRYNVVWGTHFSAVLGLSDWSNGGTPPYEKDEFHHNLIFTAGVNAYENHPAFPTRSPRDFWNNTLVSSGANDGHFILPSSSADAAYDQSFWNNLIYRSSGSPGFGGDAGSSTGAFGVWDYNGYPTNFSNSVWSPINSFDGGSTITLSSSMSNWRTISGKDANAATGTPTFAGTCTSAGNVPAANCCLANGSFGDGMGRVGGTSGGAAVDIGFCDGTSTESVPAGHTWGTP
jgi:hypothetical protein